VGEQDEVSVTVTDLSPTVTEVTVSSGDESAVFRVPGSPIVDRQKEPMGYRRKV
jgi:hypothetical protein